MLRAPPAIRRVVSYSFWERESRLSPFALSVVEGGSRTGSYPAMSF